MADVEKEKENHRVDTTEATMTEAKMTEPTMTEPKADDETASEATFVDAAEALEGRPADLIDVPVSAEDAATAERLKGEANALFSKKKYEQAAQKYTDAMGFNPRVVALYTNRAYCYIRTECYGYAIRDANRALELDAKFVKAYYRRAVAHMALGKVRDALRDFKLVCSVAPHDADAQQKLAECTKEFKRLQFEAAIASSEPQRSALSLIGDFDAIVVEAGYDGPDLLQRPRDAVRGDEPSKIDGWTRDELGDVGAGISGDFNASAATSGVVTRQFAESLLEHFRQQKKLHRRSAYQIMVAAKATLHQQPSLESIVVPDGARLTICGDVHGQFYDLLNIFARNGLPGPTNWYLFNGDFVDRGSCSVEVMLALLTFRWLYPRHFFLSRGNHETLNMNKMYGFEGEVRSKYTESAFQLFSELFNDVPIANLVQNRILVVHGGLPERDGVTLDEIRALDRFGQPTSGLMSDLLWADPQPEPGRSPSKRGVGQQFGPDVTDAFCRLNGLDCVVRSHECKDEGYVEEHDGKCITVFSAPNYCDEAGNKGAYIHIVPSGTTALNLGQSGLVPHKTRQCAGYRMDFFQFDAVPHPASIRPMQYASGFMNRLGM